MKLKGYNDKIDKLFLVAVDLGFVDEQDFAELALAATDQSGASLAAQTRVARALGIQTWEERDRAESIAAKSTIESITPKLPCCADSYGVVRCAQCSQFFCVKCRQHVEWHAQWPCLMVGRFARPCGPCCTENEKRKAKDQ